MEPPEFAHSCWDVLPSLSFTSSSLQPSSAVLGLGPDGIWKGMELGPFLLG